MPSASAGPSVTPNSPRIRPDWHYHFLGIGGVGMSALAELLRERGVRVSGSDSQGGPVLERLAAHGIPVSVGHSTTALEGANAVVYSSAVREGHPIWAEVTRRGLPRLHRAALLGALAAERRTLAVAGTHGKTTCTAALAHALATAGWAPEALVGGHLPQWDGRNYRVGDGPWLVCEADESDGSFVQLAPEAVLLTNVEEDHLDFHGTLANLRGSFQTFLGRIRPGGCLVYCAEDALAASLAAELAGSPVRTLSYGFAEETGRAVEVRVRVESLAREGTRLVLEGQGESQALTSPLVGRHNALNLCGVYALARAVDAPLPGLLAGLADFHGVARRQQFVGRAGGLAIYDDYAHHPTEIRATLECFLATHGEPVSVVFQPHLYSRTARFADAFAQALRPATRVYVTEVYGAREAPLEGVSGRMIVERLAGHPAAEFLPDWRRLPERVRAGELPPGVLLTLGAGDITGLGPLLLEALA
ncbi:MAG TPA: UDP-N-acetylmuramate--L-alanine ligase [bacterium]|nr:UDP-N-acetylmuramate--L-alanine ligase [bacterium]